jgi:hypothetical protein
VVAFRVCDGLAENRDLPRGYSHPRANLFQSLSRIHLRGSSSGHQRSRILNGLRTKEDTSKSLFIVGSCLEDRFGRATVRPIAGIQPRPQDRGAGSVTRSRRILQIAQKYPATPQV